MRVEGGGRACAAGRRAPARPFADWLRRAAREAMVRREAAAGAPPGVTRRAADARRVPPQASPRTAFPEEGRGAGPVAPLAAAAADAPAASELRAALRALPACIEASAAGGGAPLALSLAFGRSLAVELRARPGGVELLLLPDPALARACAHGLRDLVAALRRRGVAVARAEVRPRARAGPPCVDVPPPLR